MGVLRTFRVELDPSGHQNGVYYTGQVVTGFVHVDLKEEMKMRGIRLHFSGEATVKWHKITTRSKNDRKLSFKMTEKYVDQTIIIYGKASGDKGKNSVHKSGMVKYPFQVLIPERVPSSFRGKYGSIVYKMRAVIDRPWNFDETSHPLIVTIHRFVDLNRELNAHVPQQTETSVPFTILHCCSGPTQVTWTTSKSGYTPGEPIVIHGQILNNSGRRINSISAELFKKVTYHVRKSNRVHSEVLAETKVSPVPESEKDFWAGSLQLHLPLSVPPFRLDHCNIIDLQYILMIKVKMRWGRKIKCKLEIAVGSVGINTPGSGTGAVASNWSGTMSPSWSESWTNTLPSSWPAAQQPAAQSPIEDSPRPLPTAPPPPYSP